MESGRLKVGPFCVHSKDGEYILMSLYENIEPNTVSRHLVSSLLATRMD